MGTNFQTVITLKREDKAKHKAPEFYLHGYLYEVRVVVKPRTFYLGERTGQGQRGGAHPGLGLHPQMSDDVSSGSDDGHHSVVTTSP